MNLGMEHLDLFLIHWPHFAFERQHQTKIILYPADFSQKVSKLKHNIQHDNKISQIPGPYVEDVTFASLPNSYGPVKGLVLLDLI